MRRAAAAVLVVAACSPGPESARLDEATLARGRAEREFFECYDRARLATVAGDVDGARASYRAALERKPGHAASIYALAGIEHRAGRHEEALRLADRLLEVDRPRTRAFLFRAAVRSDVEAALAEGGSAPWIDLAAAERDAAEAERENPEETGPHVARAKIAILRGDRAAALDSLAKAITIHPQHAEAILLRSRCREGDDAHADVALALRITTPKDLKPPAGEGDTRASLAPPSWFAAPRLRVLAAALPNAASDWPEAAPARPETTSCAVPEWPSAPSLRAEADFDGDGALDALVAVRATEADALASLFGAPGKRAGSFTLTLGGRDATAGSGLAGYAACVGALVVVDADGDGRPDVFVLPGRGDPSRFEPALLLRNEGGGRFGISAALPPK